MELLKEIKDDLYPHEDSNVTLREAARAVVFDDQECIPLLFVAKHQYHKLPGGGIETDEGKIEALRREVREETGCEIEVNGEVGIIIEYRSGKNFSHGDVKQTSYCYYGRVGTKGTPEFTEGELADNFQLQWMTLDQAIAVLEHDTPNNFEGTFITERDLVFLQKVKSVRSMENHLKNRPHKTIFPLQLQNELRTKAIQKIENVFLPAPEIEKILLIGSSVKGSFGQYQAPGFRGSLFSDFDFIFIVTDKYSIPDWLTPEPDGKPFADTQLNLAYRNRKFIDDTYDCEFFFVRSAHAADPAIQNLAEQAGIPLTTRSFHPSRQIYPKQQKQDFVI